MKILREIEKYNKKSEQECKARWTLHKKDRGEGYQPQALYGGGTGHGDEMAGAAGPRGRLGE